VSGPEVIVIQRLTSSVILSLVKRLAPGYVGTPEESDALVAGIREAIRDMAREMDLA
jgi:hypothetical protein